MLESVFLFIMSLGIFLTILTALDRDEIAWPILTFIVWVVCSVASSNIEKVYAFLDEGAVIEGTVAYSGGPFLIIFFAGIAVVFITIFFNRILAIFSKTTTGQRDR